MYAQSAYPGPHVTSPERATYTDTHWGPSLRAHIRSHCAQDDKGFKNNAHRVPYFSLQKPLRFAYRGYGGRMTTISVDQVRGHGQGGQYGQGRSAMVCNHRTGSRHNLGSEDDGEYRQNAEAQQASAEDRRQELKGLHFKDSGGENQQLEGGGWGQHGRDHQGQELLLFKAVAEPQQPGLVDAFEQKQLAAGASDVKGNQAAESGACGGRQAKQPAPVRVAVNEPGHQGVHGHTEGGGVESGYNQDTPGSQGFECGDHRRIFQKKLGFE